MRVTSGQHDGMVATRWFMLAILSFAWAATAGGGRPNSFGARFAAIGFVGEGRTQYQTRGVSGREARTAGIDPHRRIAAETFGVGAVVGSDDGLVGRYETAVDPHDRSMRRARGACVWLAIRLRRLQRFSIGTYGDSVGPV